MIKLLKEWLINTKERRALKKSQRQYDAALTEYVDNLPKEKEGSFYGYRTKTDNYYYGDD